MSSTNSRRKDVGFRNPLFILIALAVPVMIIAYSVWNVASQLLPPTPSFMPSVMGSFPLNVKWRFQADGKVTTAPSVGNGLVVVRTDKAVYALDLLSGGLDWKIDFGGDPVNVPARIVDDLVVVANRSGVWALDARTGDTIWKDESGFTDVARVETSSMGLVCVVDFSGEVIFYDERTGQMRWKVATSRGGADVFMEKDVVYLLLSDKLQAYDSTGRLLYEDKWGFSRFNRLEANVLYSMPIEMGDKTLMAYDVQGRTVLWRKALPGEIYQFSVIGDTIFVGTAEGVMALNKSRGSTQWLADGIGSDEFDAPVLLQGIVYARGEYSKKLWAISADDGIALGYVATGTPGSIPVVHSYTRYGLGPVADTTTGRLILSVDDKVFAYGR